MEITSSDESLSMSILYETCTSIAIIRFNRPEKPNAQNDQLTRDFI